MKIFDLKHLLTVSAVALSAIFLPKSAHATQQHKAQQALAAKINVMSLDQWSNQDLIELACIAYRVPEKKALKQELYPDAKSQNKIIGDTVLVMHLKQKPEHIKILSALLSNSDLVNALKDKEAKPSDIVEWFKNHPQVTAQKVDEKEEAHSFIFNGKTSKEEEKVKIPVSLHKPQAGHISLKDYNPFMNSYFKGKDELRVRELVKVISEKPKTYGISPMLAEKLMIVLYDNNNHKLPADQDILKAFEYTTMAIRQLMEKQNLKIENINEFDYDTLKKIIELGREYQLIHASNLAEEKTAGNIKLQSSTQQDVLERQEEAKSKQAIQTKTAPMEEKKVAALVSQPKPQVGHISLQDYNPFVNPYFKGADDLKVRQITQRIVNKYKVNPTLAEKMIIVLYDSNNHKLPADNDILKAIEYTAKEIQKQNIKNANDLEYNDLAEIIDNGHKARLQAEQMYIEAKKVENINPAPLFQGSAVEEKEKVEILALDQHKKPNNARDQKEAVNDEIKAPVAQEVKVAAKNIAAEQKQWVNVDISKLDDNDILNLGKAVYNTDSKDNLMKLLNTRYQKNFQKSNELIDYLKYDQEISSKLSKFNSMDDINFMYDCLAQKKYIPAINFRALSREQREFVDGNRVEYLIEKISMKQKKYENLFGIRNNRDAIMKVLKSLGTPLPAEDNDKILKFAKKVNTELYRPIDSLDDLDGPIKAVLATRKAPADFDEKK